MNWLGSNWIWIVAVAGILALHLFGHGHGGHGAGHRHRRRQDGDADDRPQSAETRPAASAQPPDGNAMAHSHVPSTAGPGRGSVPNTANDGAARQDRPARRRRGC